MSEVITFTGFSGCDMLVVQNDKVVGELQAITFSLPKPRAPVYSQGAGPDPRTFSRGRAVAGTLLFTVVGEGFNATEPFDAILTWGKEKAVKVRGVELLNEEGLGLTQVEPTKPCTFIARRYEDEFNDFEYIERVVGNDDL